MALDTQEKRMLAASVGRPWMRATYPTATPDAEWRASVGHAYGGVYTVVIPPGPSSTTANKSQQLLLT